MLQRLAQQQADLASAGARVGKAEGELEAAETKAAQAAAAAAAATVASTALTTEARDAKAVKAKLAKATKAVATVQARVTKLERLLANCRDEAKEAEQAFTASLDGDDADVTAANAALVKARVGLSALADEHARQAAQLDQAQAALAVAEGQRTLAALFAEGEANDKALADARADEEEFVRSLDKTRTEIEQLDIQATRLNREAKAACAALNSPAVRVAATNGLTRRTVVYQFAIDGPTTRALARTANA